MVDTVYAHGAWIPEGSRRTLTITLLVREGCAERKGAKIRRLGGGGVRLGEGTGTGALQIIDVQSGTNSMFLRLHRWLLLTLLRHLQLGDLPVGDSLNLKGPKPTSKSNLQARGAFLLLSLGVSVGAAGVAGFRAACDAYLASKIPMCPHNLEDTYGSWRQWCLWRRTSTGTAE